MVNRIIQGLILLLSLSPVFAQQKSELETDRMYVTDQLRLSLYTDPNSSSQVVRLLQSGALLEIEQLQGPYALVTAQDGSKGWVKRGFLVSKPTANLLLGEEQVKNQKLSTEIERLNNSKIVIEQYEKDMDLLVEKIDAMVAEKQQADGSIAELQQVIDAKQREIDRKHENLTAPLMVLWEISREYWDIVGLVVLLIVLISFLISKQIVESRIKARFHGIKIW